MREKRLGWERAENKIGHERDWLMDETERERRVGLEIGNWVMELSENGIGYYFTKKK